MANGGPERFNQVLQNMISTYVNSNQTNWDENLNLITSAYRGCVHQATGFTPNYLMMGREAIIPVDVSLGCILENKISSVDYAIQLQEKLTEAHHIARTNLQKNAVRQKRDYDTRISKTHFSKGQLVLCLEKSRHKGISKKIDPNIWKGPYVITRKITDPFV
ncbi:uncharacterized protein LOC128558862 [Mercenaria mercenaria]|uniref:uncharacterized protein LOC128558862 n=1 Tax=Mercenaria mercenaria TaxID=6596 RepID=UPI00234F50E0|nr:uncharacterized protein LOC128558862 [Mercenaria mercenaria]